jgi:MFS family permease
MKKNENKRIFSQAFIFILLMGFVSLFSDMTHEGANSVIGDFLTLSGANTTAIGFVSGLGMFIGYTLRILTGYVADKTKKYWLITILGYVLDLICIPLLALVPENGWILACFFITMEKVGKAIKKPAKDSLVSFASTQEGVGKSFAIQEFIDQFGAFLGPIIVFLCATYLVQDTQFKTYLITFAILGIPALTCFIFLIIAKTRFPHPENFEKPSKTKVNSKIINKTFVLFIISICLFGFGFVDFSLITVRAAELKLVPENYLALLYSLAMLIDALSALIFGYLYDKKNFLSLVISCLIASPFSFFIFYANSLWQIIVGVVLWGVGMGAVESVFKAVVTTITTKENRSKGFGIYDTFLGLFWFLGSWLLGYLYNVSLLAFCLVSFICQILAVMVYIFTYKSYKNDKKEDAQESLEINKKDNSANI